MIRCPACGRQTSENFPVCAQCGASLPSAQKAPGSDVGRILATIFLCLAGLAAAGVFAAVAAYRHWLTSIPVYAQAVSIAGSSPQVQQILGSPVREGWFVSGTRRDAGLGGFAQMTIPVSGPRGKGKICVVANRVRGQWTLENVSFSDGANKLTDMTPAFAKSAFEMLGNGPVCVVPLGDFDTRLLAGLPDYYRQRFGIDVRVLPAMPLDKSVDDPKRQQAIADKIIDVLRSAPVLSAEPEAIIIGVTDRDMYAYDWNYAISYRTEQQFGVISTAQIRDYRFFEGQNPAVLPVRLRKDLTKNIALLRGKLPVSNDPTSALYESLSSGSELDLMSDDFTGADGRWRPYIQQGDVCVSVWRLPDGHLRWFLECTYDPPANTGIETFEVDLSTAEGIEQRTDFDSRESFPLSLIRKYEDHDPQVHAFGVAASHSLNIWLYPDDLPGKSYSRAELILPDTGRIYLLRTSPGGDRDGAVFHVQGMQSTPYDHATMRWNGDGWDLRRNDGWTMEFPDISGARHQRQAALIGLHDEQGHAFQFVREGTGNLMSVTSPWGYALQFAYDEQRRTVHAWDNRGRSVEYGYDAAGRLASVSSNDSQSVRYVYNERNQITEIDDAAGKTIVSNEYDPNGFLVRQTLGDGQVFGYSYRWKSVRNGAVTITEPDGAQTEFLMSNGSYVQSLPMRGTRKVNVAENTQAQPQN